MLAGMFRRRAEIVVSGYPRILSTTLYTDELGGSATKNVPMPATVAAGDLLLVIIQFGASAVVATPAGWTLVSTITSGTSRSSCFSKLADGSEGGTTVAFTTSGTPPACAQVFRIRSGTFSLSPVAASSATANPPPLSPTWGAAKSLWIAIFMGRAGSLSITGWPYPDGRTQNGVNNAGMGSCWVHKEASTEDPSAFSGAGLTTTPKTFTIAIRGS